MRYTGEVTPTALTFSPARYMSPKRLGVFVKMWLSKDSMLMGPGSPNRWSISLTHFICFKVRLLHQKNTTIFKKCSQNAVKVQSKV